MTTQDQLKGQEQASKAALANMSPRYRRLEWLERWVDGTQYKGRPEWFSGGPDVVPLWEREPCVVYPVVQIAAQSNTDLCLGESRFPRFAVGEQAGAKSTKGDQQANPVDAFLTKYHEISRFPTACREALTAAQGCGTAVALLGAKAGKPFIELLPAKWCTPEEGADGEIVKLTIEYPYLDEHKQPDGSWLVEAMLYRRVIDTESDTVFKPAKADPGGRAPVWEADPAKSTKHSLGFVPVVWYAFMRGCQPVNVIDGKAIHQWITDEIQAHDIARSQWHRGALYSEPQIYEIGVEPGYNPTGTGRTAMVPATEHGGPVTPDNPIRGNFLEGQATREARKKGPNHVYQYPNKDTKVGCIEYSAGALKAQQDNCSDLRIKIQESLCVVFLDPENMKFASTASGKALEAIREKQLDRCGQIREDFRDGFLVPCLKMQLRLARKLGKALKVKGLPEAIAALGADEDIEIETVFGSFYKPDPAEQKQLIELLALAAEKGLLDTETAIERAAQIFGVQDVNALKERIKRDRLAKEEREIATLKRWSNDNGGSRVPGDPPTVPASGNRGRSQDGQDDAGQAGD